MPTFLGIRTLSTSRLAARQRAECTHSDPEVEDMQGGYGAGCIGT